MEVKNSCILFWLKECLRILKNLSTRLTFIQTQVFLFEQINEIQFVPLPMNLFIFVNHK
jgi:transcriptional regulator of heat shock response